MTKQEITKERDLYFSRWIRKNCKDSSCGMIVQDIDFIIRNYKTGEMIMVEEKKRKGKMSYSQEKTYRLLDGVFKRSNEMKYRGFYLIVFSHTSFEDGVCYVRRPFDNDITMVVPKNGCIYTPRDDNEVVITKEDLIEILDLKK